MATKMQIAEEVYKEFNGDKDQIVAELMRRGLSKSGASTYYMNCHNQEMVRQRIIAPGVRRTGIYGEHTASEPVKRTVVVMLEMELTEDEDTYQTAELAVDLLNQNLSNDVKLVAATEKM